MTPARPARCRASLCNKVNVLLPFLIIFAVLLQVVGLAAAQDKTRWNPVLINKFFALYSLALLRKEVRLALLTPNQTKGVLARH